MAVDIGVLARAGISLVTGVLYLFVGRLILKREIPDAERIANTLFATWWIALAVLYLATAPWTLAGAMGVRDLAFSVAFLDGLLVLICVALWGLMGFLLYVYTGTNRWLVPLAVFYGVLAVGFVALVTWMHPIGFKAATGTELEYTRQLASSGSIILGLSFSVPIFAGALAYATLIFRVHESTPKYRIGMVAGAFMVQFGWSIVSAALGLQRRFPDSTVLLVVQQVIAIAVPILVILAYRPPAWVRRRLDGVQVGA